MGEDVRLRREKGVAVSIFILVGAVLFFFLVERTIDEWISRFFIVYEDTIT